MSIPARRSCLVGLSSLLVLAGACVVVEVDDLPDPDSTTTDASDDSGLESGDLFPDDADLATAALPYATDELLVQPLPGVDPAELAGLYDAAGATVVDELPEIDVTVLEVAAENFEAAARQLADSGLIEQVHKNYILEAQETPDDPLFARQPHITQSAIDLAWDMSTGSEDVIIGIVDSGVDERHPDLVDKVLAGWNVVDNNDDFDDPIGHGTEAAGVAAAMTDNGLGVAGVAWQSPIVAVRASDDQGRASSRDIAAGILWSVSQGARAVNVSFAPLWSNAVVQSAAEQVYQRGALVVISAGNGGSEVDARGYPEALFVGALDSQDRIASFSDRGPFVDLTAPGTGIRTTAPGGEYRLASGTSFAAPIATGLVALAWSVNPDLRPTTLVATLREQAVDLGAQGKDDDYGYGAIAGDRLLAAVTDIVEADDEDAPVTEFARPGPGARLRSRTRVEVTAEDDWGVADVVLFVDDTPVATDTRKPYRFYLDTRNFDSGAHELSAVATDLAGNAATAGPITVYFGASSGGSGPDVVIVSPSDGATAGREVQVDAEISSDVGLATLEWTVDGQSVAVRSISGRSTSVSYVWRPGDAEPGLHYVSLTVTDLRGNTTVSGVDVRVR